MADVTTDLEEDFLTCYICYDVFTEPKTLLCLHRFCEKCLERYLVRQPEVTVAKGSFPCPVCRELNPAPNPKRPAADWASLLRTDFHLKSLIKALTSPGGGQRAAKRGGSGSSPCPKHAGKERDLYCIDCGLSICHLCAGISHRGCSQVLTVTEVAADRRASVELQCREVSDRLAAMAQLRAHINSAAEGMEEQHRRAEASIQQSREAAMAAILLQERQLKQELGQSFARLRTDLSQQLTPLDSKMAQRQQALESVQSKVRAASDSALLQQDPLALNHSVLDGDERKMTTILHRLKNIRLEFHPSVNQSIKLGDVSLLNPKAETNEPTSQIQTPTRVTSPQTPGASRPQVPARRPRSKTLSTMETTFVTQKPVKVRTISGRFREDQQTPKLCDVLVLSSLKIVLVTDWANQCVKAFHERQERNALLGVGGKPWCVASVTHSSVAVSLPVASRICVLKVTPRLALQSSFFVQKSYTGLAALNSDTLVASGRSDPPCVDIINLGGEVLRSFSRDLITGRQLFQYPAYLTLLGKGSGFVVSDQRRKALICLSNSGSVEFLLQPDGAMALQEPVGVCVDRTGAIYVVEARGVVRVSPGGQLDRAVLKCSDHGLTDPRALAFDDQGLLYLTNREEEVLVFQM